MARKRIVETDAAPAAVGAYSQATSTGELVFTAGQIPLTPDGEMVTGSIEVQTERALDNLVAVLEEAGATPADVLKTTVFLADIDDFEAMNRTYASYFEEAPPARSAVQAGALPKGAGVEIEAVALVPGDGADAADEG
jgi:reactive intermediate/imine deaminase